jgi:hypothetical protein
MKSGSVRRPFLLAVAACLLESSPRPATAQLLGPEFQVNTTTLEHQEYPKVAADGAGNYVVVWVYRGVTFHRGLDLYGQRLDSAGNKLLSEFLVTSGGCQLAS